MPFNSNEHSFQFYSLIIGLLGLIGCEKDPVVYPVTVETSNNVEFVQNGVKVQGKIKSEGNKRITVDKYGFCYATTPEPTIYDNIIVNDDLEECVKFTHNVIKSAHSTPDRVSKLIANLKEELSGFSKGE